MIYTNDYLGKKAMVKNLAEVYKRMIWSDIADIELKKYRKEKREEEFIVLTWKNGAISTASNNMNSLSATARNVARMIDGGVYENLDLYKEIMTSPDWIQITGETMNEYKCIDCYFYKSGYMSNGCDYFEQENFYMPEKCDAYTKDGNISPELEDKIFRETDGNFGKPLGEIE